MSDLQLVDVSWSDILIPLVTTQLTLKDLFNLRCCSKVYKDLAEAALETRKELNFSGNNSVNITLAFGVVSNCCRRLEKLQLAKCHWLNDENLLPLLLNNRKLKIVNFNECLNITPLSLQPIIINCKDVRVLKLSKCNWLTSGAVEALTLHQSNLEEFDISHCTGIGERCLIIFFRKLNKLTVLSLSNTLVTDPVLMQIAMYCKQLEHINLVGCNCISDVGIQALTKLVRLKSLMIQRCPSVTERVLAPLRGSLFIDRPSQGYNLPALVNRLYLQV